MYFSEIYIAALHEPAWERNKNERLFHIVFLLFVICLFFCFSSPLCYFVRISVNNLRKMCTVENFCNTCWCVEVAKQHSKSIFKIGKNNITILLTTNINIHQSLRQGVEGGVWIKSLQKYDWYNARDLPLIYRLGLWLQKLEYL